MSKLSRFAGLLGIDVTAKKAEDDKPGERREEDRAGKRKGEDKKPERKDGESDEDYDARVKAWEDDQEEEEARRAEEEENCRKAKEEGEKEGRKAESTRWQTVLASTEAVGKAAMACDLLADHPDMDAAAICKILGKAAPQTTVAPRRALSDRHAQPTPAPATGTGHDDPTKQGGPKGFAARVAAAVEKTGLQKKKA